MKWQKENKMKIINIGNLEPICVVLGEVNKNNLYKGYVMGTRLSEVYPGKYVSWIKFESKLDMNNFIKENK